MKQLHPAGFYPDNASPLKVPICRVLRALHTVVRGKAWENTSHKQPQELAATLLSSRIIISPYPQVRTP